MKTIKFLFAMPAAVVIGYAVAPGEADAAYSGAISRSVCAVAAVPRRVDRDYIDYTAACHLVVNDPSPSTYRYAAASVPVERKTSTTTISSTVNYTSDGSNGFFPGACAQSFVWDSSGTLAATGANDCTSPSYWTGTLTPGSLTLPVDGSVSLSLAAIDSVVWKQIRHSWTANGT